ncbi:ultraviolet-B receptor UVR8 [Canna indica]|uniref:Ultraviolet-B receptor UVR8 n=1 Tax=Canna indica TaxID=4628 RepID=A0AAQ3QTV4_9LILI|nr:ultraviolet-B receptor UVR8 [Canna indica]
MKMRRARSGLIVRRSGNGAAIEESSRFKSNGPPGSQRSWAHQEWYPWAFLVIGAKSVVSSPTRVDCLVGINIEMVALVGINIKMVAFSDVGVVLSWGAGGSGRLGHSHTSSIFSFSKNSRCEVD